MNWDIDNLNKSYDDIDIWSKYKQDIVTYDFTEMQLPKMKLWFYNKKDEELTVMVAHKVTVQIQNDDWHQVGNHLIANKIK